MRVLGSFVLCIEAIIVFLALLVAAGSGSVQSQWTAAIIGLVIAALLVASIGVLRRPWGAWWGSIMQVVVVAIGFWAPLMFIVGGIFAVLWFVAVRSGSRIDRLKAEAKAKADGGTRTQSVPPTQSQRGTSVRRRKPPTG